MGAEYPKSVKFTDVTPEGCWRKYSQARLTPGFDWAHYPVLDKFWLHEDKKYILVVVYDHDPIPNM